MTERLAAVRDGTYEQDDYDVRMQLGTLKRYGLVELERDDEGEQWTLTTLGEAYLAGDEQQQRDAAADDAAESQAYLAGDEQQQRDAAADDAAESPRADEQQPDEQSSALDE